MGFKWLVFAAAMRAPCRVIEMHFAFLCTFGHDFRRAFQANRQSAVLND